MNISEIKPGIRYVGVNDRTTTRFEGLWSLPYGVSYNSYLLLGDKVALMDTVEESFGSRFLQNIERELDGRTIDYLIVNHMEPDHSSSVQMLRRVYPDMRIVGNAKTLQMLAGYYGIADNTLEVKEGDTLDLGGGLSLAFYFAPMVHWPEVMVSYCPEHRTLFSASPTARCGSTTTGTKCAATTPASWANTACRYRRRWPNSAHCPSRRSARHTAPYGSAKFRACSTSTTA